MRQQDFVYDVFEECSNELRPDDSTIHQLSIDVYPNPSMGDFNILFNEPFSGEIVVRDIIGNVIENEAVTEIKNYSTYNVTSDGIYIIELIDVKGMLLETKKVIKIK